MTQLSQMSQPLSPTLISSKYRQLNETGRTSATEKASTHALKWHQGLFRKQILAHMSAFDQGGIRIVEHYKLGAPEQFIGNVEQVEDGNAEAPTLNIYDPKFFTSLALHTDVGLAESYILGYWGTPDLYQFLRVLIKHIHLFDAMDRGVSQWLTGGVQKMFAWLHRNTPAGSQKNIHAHYDLGNDFFKTMLDPTMAYSSGVFEHEDATLEEASIAKFERLCQKLDLKPTDHLLEIGTGWGGFAHYAAEKYGCRITTTTISKEQYKEAEKRIQAANLSDRVSLLLKDYRELEGQYDKIVSIEMLEAVGHQFLGTFFNQCDKLLKPDGLLVMQVITMPDHRYERYRKHVDFIRRYVFPGSCCPSIAAMTQAVSKDSTLRLIELTDIGLHYAPTLLKWQEAVSKNKNVINSEVYSQQFLRLWDYYLIGCAAAFAERYTSNTHLVFAKPGHRVSSVTQPVPAID